MSEPTDPTTTDEATEGDGAADSTAEVSRPLTLPPADVDVRALGDRELLQMAIAATPDPEKPGRAIPATRFAVTVAKCNDRTLRRYLSRTQPRALRELLREKCEQIVTDAARKAARAAKASA
jgi:hypothetical protein